MNQEIGHFVNFCKGQRTIQRTMILVDLISKFYMKNTLFYSRPEFFRELTTRKNVTIQNTKKQNSEYKITGLELFVQ